ncbi:hypothetical protein J0X14_11480 [Muricauda sp. CAU 1633]|uniref:hypothetical protein n=1 Tax=Allomuricauda sp. CAU 1633 TaxID=2816036 RepID=UPI001A8D98F3|nr:hypothetical protein [Muricauda sp. CAU 1633]MBO0322918.1 hypothetical protein [Muricauda sp. CAU 1633]
MKKTIFIKMLMLFMAFSISSCCDEKPEQVEGMEVTSTSPEFSELARKINPNLDCQRIDCCFMDGVETSCALVNACLEAGFCKMVATE